MKNIILILLSLSSCYHASNEANTADIDTSSSTYLTDDIQEPSYGELVVGAINDYLSSFDKQMKIDTTFVIDQDTVVITLIYCFDKTEVLVIPKSFYIPYFDSDIYGYKSNIYIRIFLNRLLYSERTINESDYIEQVLGSDIATYGILLFPSIKLNQNSILIGLSYSIPATDIGIGLVDTLYSN